MTSERTLPALEAAHIRDYRDVEEHTISNGILFRAGIHKVVRCRLRGGSAPDYHFEVSHRIKEARNATSAGPQCHPEPA